MKRKRNAIGKTVDDVTRQEWINLTEAADELLGCARFMFWLSGGQKQEGDDTSIRDSLDKMASALTAIGLPPCSSEKFEKNLEAMLKSGQHPADWAANHKHP